MFIILTCRNFLLLRLYRVKCNGQFPVIENKVKSRLKARCRKPTGAEIYRTIPVIILDILKLFFIYNKFLYFLTRVVINGAIIDPILAHMDAEPTPTFRTTVGKISPENKYTVGKDRDMPIIPIAERMTSAQFSPSGTAMIRRQDRLATN